jgi:hypothetical protein
VDVLLGERRELTGLPEVRETFDLNDTDAAASRQVPYGPAQNKISS